MICANFFTKALVIVNKKHWIRPFTLIYYGVILSIIMLILLLCLTMDKTINCRYDLFSKSPFPHNVK